MGKMRLVAIFIAAVLGLFYGLVFAEFLYRPDSTEVEFTMGCCHRDLDTNGNTIALVALFDPIVSPDIEWPNDIYTMIDKANPDSSVRDTFDFIPYKNAFISEYLTDKVGDTLLLITPYGIVSEAITCIGHKMFDDESGPRCKISFTNPDIINNFDENTQIIALRNYQKYNGPFFHFELYALSDSLEIKLAQSLQDSVADLWVNYATHGRASFNLDSLLNLRNNPKNKYTKCFRRMEQRSSDTMFWVVYFEGYSAPLSYMVYLINKSNDEIHYQPLLPELQFGYDFKIILAMDLNGDGYLEYLVNTDDVSTIQDRLFEIRDDKLIEIASGCGWVG